MQLIPAGLLALSVHLALALGQPVRSPAESSPERCMRAMNAESGICMPKAAAPMMKMAHERKWILMDAYQQDTDAPAAAAAPIDIEEAHNSIQPILPPSPSPTASGIVTHTPVPVITSTFTVSPSATPTPTPPADYGEYSDYGDYGEYASYGDYDADVVSQAMRLD